MSSPNSYTPRQSEILEKSLTLVREGGLSGLTTRKIAERMGFSEPALYRHFPNKRAVILGLMDSLHTMLVRRVEEIAIDQTLSASEKLIRILRHHVQLVREQNSLPILLLAEASTSEDPELLARMRTVLQTYLGHLTDIILEGQGEGTIDTSVRPDCLALGLMGTPTALAIKHRLMPDDPMEDRIEDTWIPFLIERMGPDEESH